MLFVIGIFGILTAIVVFNYGNFNNNVIMTNLAYEVALEIRQAQVYSLGVRSAGATPGASSDVRDAFDTRYGVYFDLGQEAGPTNFVSFADFWPSAAPFDFEDNTIPVAGDDKCTNSNSTTCSVSSCGTEARDECRQIAKLVRGITFERFCVITDNGAGSRDPVNLEDGTCTNSNNQVDDLTITFARPYTNAIINGDDDKNAGIVLKSTGGSKRAVIVKSSGQISVEFINNN